MPEDVTVTTRVLGDSQPTARLRVRTRSGSARLTPDECRDLARELHRAADEVERTPPLDEQRRRIRELHEVFTDGDRDVE